MSEQNYANHVKWVPLFHFFLVPVFTINFAWSLYHLKKTGFSLHAAGYYWYVFNIADVASVAGVAGLLYDSIIASRKNAQNAD